MTDSSKKVVRPRGRSAAARATVDPEDATSPGDTISFSLSGEVNNRGQKAWPKVSLDSKHRVGETTAEASERVASYVIDTFNEFVKEFKG